MQPKRKTSPTRACERCGGDAPRLFRVRSAQRAWHLVCRACYDRAVGEPGFSYGGTWTGRRWD
jgi:hypothetical protein